MEVKRLFGKGNATKFLFTFTIHSLAPWPQGQKPVAIGWQRGKAKRGATHSVYPVPAPAGRTGAVVKFDETFELDTTLYKVDGAKAFGPFKPKTITLAVFETDSNSRATAALGRLVVDLAEFAGIDQSESRSFPISCNRNIQQLVGQPAMTVSIRCTWTRPESLGQEASLRDISDRSLAGIQNRAPTGPKINADLMSFFHQKYNNSGMEANSRQDTTVIDSTPAVAMVASSVMQEEARVARVKQGLERAAGRKAAAAGGPASREERERESSDGKTRNWLGPTPSTEVNSWRESRASTIQTQEFPQRVSGSGAIQTQEFPQRVSGSGATVSRHSSLPQPGPSGSGSYWEESVPAASRQLQPAFSGAELESRLTSRRQLSFPLDEEDDAPLESRRNLGGFARTDVSTPVPSQSFNMRPMAPQKGSTPVLRDPQASFVGRAMPPRLHPEIAAGTP